MTEEQQRMQDVVTEVRNNVNVFLAKVIQPKVEHHIEVELKGMIERIIEKKIEERFAFAIELLRSMNDKAKSSGA